MVEAAVELQGDERSLAGLRSRLAALDLRNGVDVAAKALSRWWPLPVAQQVTQTVAPPCEAATRAARQGRLRIMHVILSSGFAGSRRAAAEA
jgi:hypothetical protein